MSWKKAQRHHFGRIKAREGRLVVMDKVTSWEPWPGFYIWSWELTWHGLDCDHLWWRLRSLTRGLHLIKSDLEIGKVWFLISSGEVRSFFLITIPHPPILLIFVGRPAREYNYGNDEESTVQWCCVNMCLKFWYVFEMCLELKWQFEVVLCDLCPGLCLCPSLLTSIPAGCKNIIGYQPLGLATVFYEIIIFYEIMSHHRETSIPAGWNLFIFRDAICFLAT